MQRKYIKYKPGTTGHQTIFYIIFLKLHWQLKLDKNVDADFTLQLQNTETFIKYSKNMTIQAKTHLGTVVLGIVEIVSSSKHTLFDKQRRGGSSIKPDWLLWVQLWHSLDRERPCVCARALRACTRLPTVNTAKMVNHGWFSGVIVQSHNDSTSPTGMSDLYPSEEQPHRDNPSG